MTEPTLTLAEAASVCGVCTRTVERWITRGGMHGGVVPKRVQIVSVMVWIRVTPMRLPAGRADEVLRRLERIRTEALARPAGRMAERFQAAGTRANTTTENA